MPGSGDEIGMVVSTAAKVYAQRLVAAAAQIAGRDNASGSTKTPLQPQHVWQAVQERQQAGLDPGFFLQSSHDCFQWSRPQDNYNQRRLAALQAQEAYEQKFGNNEEQDDDKMKVDEETKEDTPTVAAASPATASANQPNETAVAVTKAPSPNDKFLPPFARNRVA